MAKTALAPYGKREHEAAVARGKQTKSAPTAILRAIYDVDSGNLLLDLQNGARVALPASSIEELSGQPGPSDAFALCVDDLGYVQNEGGYFWPDFNLRGVGYPVIP